MGRGAIGTGRGWQWAGGQREEERGQWGRGGRWEGGDGEGERGRWGWGGGEEGARGEEILQIDVIGCLGGHRLS